ncbi:MAG: hypothetical protein QNJ14_04215 [Woeseiaceae bacterium]|nr:hypothetical protein [Woeseiaceae bacterium]
MNTKTCRTCGIEKPTSEFGKASKNADGLNIHCRPCHNRKTQERKAAKFANMSLEELESYRPNRGDPEKRKANRARAKRKGKLIEYMEIIEEIEALLAYAAEHGNDKRWSDRSPGTKEYDWPDPEMVTTADRLRASAYQTMRVRGVICYDGLDRDDHWLDVRARLQGLRKFLADTPEDELQAACKLREERKARVQATATQDAETDSVTSGGWFHHWYERMREESLKERRKDWAALTPEERAEVRADSDAEAIAMRLHDGTSDSQDIDKAKKQYEEWQQGDRPNRPKHPDELASERYVAMCGSKDFGMHKAAAYAELYPKYLEEEQQTPSETRPGVVLLSAGNDTVDLLSDSLPEYDECGDPL